MRLALSIPSLFSLARLALTPVVAVSILQRQYPFALVVFLAAGITDVVDGYIARRFQLVTRVGAWLDPVTDKVLLSAIYICLAVAGALPVWLVVLVFGRDVLILLMAGWALLFTRLREFPPSVWGKLSTFVQIVTAVVVMGHEGRVVGGLEQPARWMVWAAAAATGWSGLHYFYRGVERLREIRIDASQPHR